MINRNSQNFSLVTAKIGIFSALYVVTGIIPISLFIGAPSFLTLNIVLTPTIAYLLTPMEAFSVALIGGLISLYFLPTQAMFGFFSILLPIAGATFGSLAIHKRKEGKILSAIFLATSIIAYLLVNHQFPFFIAPHILAIALLLVFLSRININAKYHIPLSSFISTMCEQGMMMIFAVYLLKLPWAAFSGILPLMLYERAIATIGASLLIVAVKRSFPILQ